MKVINYEFEDGVPVGILKRHPENARVGDRPAIAESIKANGFYGALIVQRETNHILIGNHRYETAVELGAEFLPVFWIHCSDAAAKRIMLADNRTNDLASNNEAKLLAVLQGIMTDAGTLEGTGYLDIDIRRLEASLAGEPDAPKQPQLVTCPKCGHQFTKGK